MSLEHWITRTELRGLVVLVKYVRVYERPHGPTLSVELCTVCTSCNSKKEITLSNPFGEDAPQHRVVNMIG